MDRNWVAHGNAKQVNGSMLVKQKLEWLQHPQSSGSALYLDPAAAAIFAGEPRNWGAFDRGLQDV